MRAMHRNTPATNVRFGHLPQSFAISDLEFESAGDFNQITTTTHRQKQLWLNPTPSQTEEFRRDSCDGAICCRSNEPWSYPLQMRPLDEMKDKNIPNFSNFSDGRSSFVFFRT